MYTYAVKRRRFVFEGNEIMKLSASVPQVENLPAITDFYSDISNNFIKWCEESAFPLLCEEYKALSQQKYIYRKKSYSLRADLTYFSESLICVLTQVSSAQFRGESRTLFEEYQVWSLRECELLPPKYAARLISRELGIKIPTAPTGMTSAGTDGKALFFTPIL
ncbi:MAG: hypothetical protein IJV72_04485 [Clostridia bacterium]|nr:hypothetical protein [Clostridia bacterium]